LRPSQAADQSVVSVQATIATGCTGLARDKLDWHDSGMGNVVHRIRRLHVRPSVTPVPRVSLRAYRGDEDVAVWLRLREQAFARQKLGVRQWDADDFRRELLEKPWWRPDWMWFAETSAGEAIGTVTLAIRQSATTAVPVVHWLCVLPRWRRRGIGRLLMNTLEQAAWDAGYREVALETHEAWREAAAAYDAMGYRVDNVTTD
jgi:GNAT superfamily N-acetyltransferase